MLPLFIRIRKLRPQLDVQAFIGIFSRDMLVKFGKREFESGDAAIVEQRQVQLFFGIEVVERDAGKIGNDDVSGDFVDAAFAREVLNVAKGLRFGLAEVFAEAFVLDENNFGPEQIDVAVVAGDSLYRFLEAGYCAAVDAKHVKKVIPKCLLFGLFPFGARPFVCKGDGAVANFVPGERHEGGIISERARGE